MSWASEQFERRKVIVCVGPGGVGKTTVAATLALRARLEGKKVLCLTIDPARRLAQALGLTEISKVESRVSDEWLGAASDSSGLLDVMMLDIESTLEDIILENSRDPSSVEQLLSSRAYKYLAKNLAGMQSYMAMEKVLALDRARGYDLIVLDTPPSYRAIDFFDAPTRMGELLESPVTKTLSQVGRATSGGGIWGRGARAAFRGIGRVTSSGLLEELGELLGMFRELLGGFEERAARAWDRFRSSDYGYLIVVTPDPLACAEAEDLVRELDRRSLSLDALLMNRVLEPLPSDLTEQALLSALGGCSASNDPIRFRGLLETWSKEAAAHEQARSALARLRLGAPVLHLPRLLVDVHQPRELVRLARSL